MFYVPQVTIYVDPETERKMRSAARAEGLSLSRWIGRLVKERTRSDWPESVKALAGAWQDLPTADELRKSRSTDVEREPL